jgi:two-component system, OmpR family, phosphate regulon sensor histidine kinase PhoR
LRLGVRAKLFLISFGLIVVAIVVVYSYARSRLERDLVERLRSELIVRAQLVAHAVEAAPAPQQRAGWVALASHLGTTAHSRVTLLGRDGSLLGDSEGRSDEIEHYREASEVQSALAVGEKALKRHFTAIEGRTLFVVVPFSRSGTLAGFARVGLPLTDLDQALIRLGQTLTVAAVLALLVALVMSTIAAQLASRTARTLTDAARKMADGDLKARTRVVGEDEFGELARALDRMAKNLSASLGELTAERDRMSAMLVGMQEGVLLLDDEAHIVLHNPALREMLLLGADAIGKTVLEAVRHAELKELFDEAAELQEPVSREIELGSLKPRRLLVRVAPLAHDHGPLFAVFVDVTEVRKLESMRRDFVANVSHELRTPVTAVRSAVETLLAGAVDQPADARKFLNIAERNAERLHSLVEDLLELSRIESRGYRLQLESLDPSLVATQVLELFRGRAEAKHIRLVDAVPRDLPPARTDRRALEHVLTNLVDNAVKYSGPDTTVRVTARAEATVLIFSVTDDGPGIEARHLDRIFERFYRIDPGRSRDLGGTGLGLSIVKNMVEAMGGKVRVESSPGEGATFSFTLPKGDAEAEFELPAPAP